MSAPKLHIVFNDRPEQPDLAPSLLASIRMLKRGWIQGYANALYDTRPRFDREPSPYEVAKARAAYHNAAERAYAERFGEK